MIGTEAKCFWSSSPVRFKYVSIIPYLCWLVWVKYNLVFAPYLKNEWTEFNQILYTHHWHDLRWDCKPSSFLQICNRVTTLDWRQNLVQPWTSVLAALDQLKYILLTFWELFKNSCLLSGERSLPFGLLVIIYSTTLSLKRCICFFHAISMF